MKLSSTQVCTMGVAFSLVVVISMYNKQLKQMFK